MKKKRIYYDNTCPECGTEIVREVPDHICPECGGWMKSSAYCFCDHCGEMVELNHFTGTCRCGAVYNSFGREVSPAQELVYKGYMTKYA